MFSTSAPMEKITNFDGHMAMQAALVMPEGVANFLPLRADDTEVGETFARVAALEWSNEHFLMSGFVENGGGTRCRTLTKNLAVGTKMLHMRKKNNRGEVQKHKYRLEAKRFQQGPGLHLNLKSAPAVSGSSLGMVVATAAMKDRNLRYLGVEQAFVQATANE